MLLDCETTHSDCRNYQVDAILPSRVLEIEPAGGLHLVEIKDDLRASYTALSHCWGVTDKSQLTLTSDNLTRLKEQIDVRALTPVFQDAVHLTRHLGIKYLWIDALCILQDDKFDWARQSARMASTYHGSTLTIAASSSSDGHKPFLRPRPRQVRFQFEYYSPRIDRVGCLCFALDKSLDSISSHHLQQPLQSRAWCLQEQLLSRRIIYFDTEQYLWECPQGRFPEASVQPVNLSLSRPGYPDTMPFTKLSAMYFRRRVRSRPQFMSNDIAVNWYRTLAEFCSRDLTYPESDLLPALSGVAEFYGKMTSDTYLAGIWWSDFHRGLLWRFKRDVREPLQRSSFAPTWSWASVCQSSATLMEAPLPSTDLSFRRNGSISLLEARLTPLLEDERGQLQVGSLHLRGLAKDVWLDKDVITQRKEDASYALNVRRGGHRFAVEAFFDDDWQLPSGLRYVDDRTESFNHVLLLLAEQRKKKFHEETRVIVDVYLQGLILYPKGPDSFVRRGTFSLFAKTITKSIAIDGEESDPDLHFSDAENLTRQSGKMKKCIDVSRLWPGWRQRDIIIV